MVEELLHREGIKPYQVLEEHEGKLLDNGKVESWQSWLEPPQAPLSALDGGCGNPSHKCRQQVSAHTVCRTEQPMKTAKLHTPVTSAPWRMETGGVAGAGRPTAWLQVLCETQSQGNKMESDKVGDNCHPLACLDAHDLT